MARNRYSIAVFSFLALTFTAVLARADDPLASLKTGDPGLKSAGPLAFGPDGILFVGDTRGAALFAIDTGDRTAAGEKRSVEIKDLTTKLAGMLGTNPRQIMINDLAVNPLSGNVYLSVSRGRGPDATPLLVRVNADAKIEEIPLDKVRFAKAEIPNAPEENAQNGAQAGAGGRGGRGAGGGPQAKGGFGGGNPRNESITDISYMDGRVFIAGLSNEEFSSRLIVMPFPFSSEGFDGASIEIYHGSHGRLETKSPIRTFVTYRIQNEPHMLAAYTCTPLVKVPLSELKAGAHVRGTTIAELGNRNRPLDMVVYQKDGKDYLLMTNSSRGVMKIPTEGAGTAQGIVAPVRDKQGIGYETIDELKGVVQMDQLDNHHAVLLVQQDPNGSSDLKTIELP
jgi:hypothetical protein